MSNDGRERGTIKLGDVKLEGNRMTVPPLPVRDTSKEHWAKRWPSVDLIEGSRVMVGFNTGSTLRARIKSTWRSEQTGANYGRYVASFIFSDNRDPEMDGAFGTEWADELYPLHAQVIVGYGSDEHAFMIFDDWDRAQSYVDKHNQRAADDAVLELEGLMSDPLNEYTAEDMAEHRRTLTMDKTAHLRPVMVVPEWATMPSVEV